MDRNSHTHTTVLLLFWNLSGTTRVSRFQKGKQQEGKTNRDLLEQEIVSGSGICWAICNTYSLRPPARSPPAGNTWVHLPQYTLAEFLLAWHSQGWELGTQYSSLQHASPIRELTCPMGWHSVTCRLAEVTLPPLTQPIEGGSRFCEEGERLSWPYLLWFGYTLKWYTHPVLAGLNVEYFVHATNDAATMPNCQQLNQCCNVTWLKSKWAYKCVIEQFQEIRFFTTKLLQHCRQLLTLCHAFLSCTYKKFDFRLQTSLH